MDLNQLFDVYEKMDPETYSKTLNEKMNKVLPELAKLTVTMPNGTKYTGMDLLVNFLVATVVSDRKVYENELALVSDIMTQLIDPKYDLAYTLALIAQMGTHLENLQNFADMMIDGLGQINPELKEDLVLVCLLVASVDGKVSDEEKEFISRLLA